MQIIKCRPCLMDEFVLRPEHEEAYLKNVLFRVGTRCASTVSVFISGIIIGALGFFIIMSLFV